ncbi:hypothetical protein [Microbacterium sp. 3J1]|uniref:hypothetical protein n=1 Tax=Microbacterium sp. 3J1 TaxID=861269 RepID=UPI000A9C12FE|nr:hypothetical protein [Microbacterium sp. 3J1]
MRLRRTLSLTAAVAGVMTFGLVSTANALWTTNDALMVPELRTGAVSFGAAADSQRVQSESGEPVEIRVPGSEIARVLDDGGLRSDPAIWRFEVAGAALGIAGLDYDIALGPQVWRDGRWAELDDGVAEAGTLLADSTLRIYPAGLGDDCSAIPDAPADLDGAASANVHLIEASDRTLQAPSANPAGAEITQVWCVAMLWNHRADGLYISEASAAGIGDDGSENRDVDSWYAAVAFPASLDAIGVYDHTAWAEGTGDDGTLSRDDSSWSGTVRPDPSGEPDLVVRIDPRVTNANPAVPPGDHATR